MGTDVLEVAVTLPSPCDIKVHSLMCTDLTKLVEKIVKIFPEIEAARPRCSSGIQSLVLLIGAIDKAKLLLHDCCESSKLYLALNGNTILSRCKRSKNLLEQSLTQIQNMVPVMLASEISRIIAQLRAVTFILDPSEEEAGKAVKSLLEQYKTGEFSGRHSSNEYIQIATLKLQITTQKALLMERRSIKKLLNKLIEKDGNQTKKQILLFLLDLLKKYGNSITSGQLETDNNIVHDQDYPSQKVDFRVDHDLPPEEFKCPISLKLMYDPVIIDSGQTFERMWIQKWFDEGHDICPKTKRKILNFSLTPNTALKDLILKWCEAHGIIVNDPCIMVSSDANAWENSSSSINSLSISMNNLQLPVDYSNVSMSSLDNTREMDVEICREIDDALPWEFQCKVVEDLTIRLKHNDHTQKMVSYDTLVGSVMRFLKVARDVNDVKAMRIGCLLLLTLITKCRSIRYLNKDAYELISEFLESEVIEEALAIIEALSSHKNCLPELAASRAIAHIFNILDTKTRQIQTLALKILYNLTSTQNTRSIVSSLDLIPKLVTLFEDDSLSRYCMAILGNLSNNQSNRSIIADTEGCVSFIARVLESESFEEQEQALEILVSLCSQSVSYCRLVMNEGVIPSVVSISINGNEKGKAKAFEMLRLLKEIEFDECVEEVTPVVAESGFSKDINGFCVEKKTGSGASRILSKLILRRSLAQKRKI